MELFRLFGSIFIDTDAAEKSMQKVEQAAEKLGSKLEKYGNGISDMGGKLTKTVTAGVTALGTASVVSASSFEDAMAKVSTIADESEMSMDDMRAAILGLSDQTGISAVAIAEDVYNAISAGQKTADAVNFVSNSTKLARAGFAETGQSLDVLTTIMNAYGMEAGEVTRVSDVLIQTQNLGKTTVAELSSSMGKVIPTAKAQGVELETLCGAYAVMTSNGIATAETTTYLNSMLNELGKQGSSAADAFAKGTEHIKEGGLTMSEAMERGWELTDVLSILDEQAYMSGTSISNMFGSAEAGKAAAVLWDNAQKLNGAIGEMGASAGSTEEAFGKLETTSFKAQKAINEAKNVLVDLGGAVIEMLVPYLEKGAEKVHEFAEWFKGLDDGTKELIVKIGLLAAAVGPLLSVFGKGVSVIGNVISIGGKLSGGISGIIKIGGGLAAGAAKVIGLFSGAASFIGTTLVPAIASIGAPVLAVIGVVTALVAAGVALYKNWDEICEWAGKAWSAVKDTIGVAIDGIKGFFSDLKEKASAKFHELTENVGSKAEELKEKVTGKISEMKEKAVDKFEELKEKASERIASMKEKAVNGFEELKEKAVEKVSALKEKAASKFEELKEKASEKVSSLKEKAVSRFEELKEQASEKVSALKEKAVSRFEELKEKAGEKVASLKEKAVSGFEELNTKAALKVGELAKATVSKFEEMKSGALERFEHLKSGISDKLEAVKGFVSNAVQRLKGFFDFEWKLPKIKLPHFSIEGEFSLSPPSIPHIGVDWYAKAMDVPMVMDRPTAFGISRSGQLMAGGEAGSEVVSGTETLMRMISEAVAENNEQLYGILDRLYGLLSRYLPACAQKQLVLDTGALVGELAGPMDEELGWRAHMRGRRN